MTFYVEHDGDRFDFATLNRAADYFHGCLVDEAAPDGPIRLIDSDGKTVIAVIDFDGIQQEA